MPSACVQADQLGAHLHAELRVEVRSGSSIRNASAARRAPARSRRAGAGRRTARAACAPAGPRCSSRRATSRPALRFALLDPLLLKREADVVGDGHVRVERVVLEDHRDVALRRRQVVDHAPPIRISPLVISSSPATIRSAVVLPQPEGPTRIRNSPSSTSRLRRSTARTSVPNCLLTCANWTVATS